MLPTLPLLPPTLLPMSQLTAGAEPDAVTHFRPCCTTSLPTPVLITGAVFDAS